MGIRNDFSTLCIMLISPLYNWNISRVICAKNFIDYRNDQLWHSFQHRPKNIIKNRVVRHEAAPLLSLCIVVSCIFLMLSDVFLSLGFPGIYLLYCKIRTPFLILFYTIQGLLSSFIYISTSQLSPRQISATDFPAKILYSPGSVTKWRRFSSK